MVIVFKASLGLIFPFKSEFWDSQISEGMVGFGRGQGDEVKYGINREIGKKGWVHYFVCFPSSWLRNSLSPVLYWSQSLLPIWKLGSFWAYGQPYLHCLILCLHILLLPLIFSCLGIIPEIHTSPFVLGCLLRVLLDLEVPFPFAHPWDQILAFPFPETNHVIFYLLHHPAISWNHRMVGL